MTTPLPLDRPHVPAIALLTCERPPHARGAHWEITWSGPFGIGRSGQWYPTYAAARAMAESCGATDISGDLGEREEA